MIRSHQLTSKSFAYLVVINLFWTINRCQFNSYDFFFFILLSITRFLFWIQLLWWSCVSQICDCLSTPSIDLVYVCKCSTGCVYIGCHYSRKSSCNIDYRSLHRLILTIVLKKVSSNKDGAMICIQKREHSKNMWFIVYIPNLHL